MRYWWVNQNQTYKHEVPGGFLWSPKTKANGGRNKFYDFMEEVVAGDVIFSFCDTRIKAIGVATGVAQTAQKPDFRTTGSNWSQEGWLVPVEFSELEKQVRPKDHIDTLRPYLPTKYAPLQQNGDGLQAVYLTSVPPDLAQALIALIGTEYARVLARLHGDVNVYEVKGDIVEGAIKGRTDIGETMKEQLVKSRRGQGIFKANVRLNERACRITGVSDPKHLRASHIRPWADCSDEEKLNGCNGLLLAPHVDHLFDRGYISFADNGDLIISVKLEHEVLSRWGILTALNVGPFNSEQAIFLEYHRNNILQA